MITRPIQILPLIFLLLTATVQSHASENTNVMEAYELSRLRTPDGVEHTMADFINQGKWTVVVLWASDCSACNAEAENYADLHNRRKDKDLSVFGMSVDGWDYKDDAIAFIKRNKVTFPNLIGDNTYISQIYGKLSGTYLVGTPAILLYDKKAELQAAQIGAVPVSIIEDFVDKSSK